MASLAPLNTANLVTSVRVFAIPFFLSFTLTGRSSLAALVIIIAGVSDALDGYLARRLKQTSAFGAAFDALADKLLLTSAFGALFFAGLIPLWLFFVVALRDFIMLSAIFICKLTGRSLNTNPVKTGKINTFFQVVCVLFALLVDSVPFSYLIYFTTAFFTILCGLEYGLREISIDFKSIAPNKGITTTKQSETITIRSAVV